MTGFKIWYCFLDAFVQWLECLRSNLKLEFGVVTGGWELSATLLYRQGRFSKVQERVSKIRPGTFAWPCEGVVVC